LSIKLDDPNQSIQQATHITYHFVYIVIGYIVLPPPICNGPLFQRLYFSEWVIMTGTQLRPRGNLPFIPLVNFLLRLAAEEDIKRWEHSGDIKRVVYTEYRSLDCID